MTIYLCADLHLNHKNILKYEPCRIEQLGMATDTIQEMNEKIIERWNSVVKPEDTVYCLGDVSFGAFDVSVLNGYKILIKGNHDRSDESMYRDGWNEVMNEFHFFKDGVVYLLTHEPVSQECILNDYCYNIHGHLHSKPSPTKQHICVSMEQINCTPIGLEQLLEKINEL